MKVYGRTIKQKYWLLKEGFVEMQLEREKWNACDEIEDSRKSLHKSKN